MTKLSCFGFSILAATAVAIIAGCSGNSMGDDAIPLQAKSAAQHARPAVASRYVYVTDRTLGELLVYPALVPSPSPIRTVTSGLNVVQGVTTDTSGNVYVANDPSGTTGVASVREYNSGATSLIRSFTSGLHHPIDVAIGPSGTVFVTDQNGASSEILEYASTGGSPIGSVTTPRWDAFPRGVAVDSSGDVFADFSGNADIWPPDPACEAINLVYEYVGGLGGTPARLYATEQNWGLALDGTTLYESDFCLPQLFKTTPPYLMGSGTGISAINPFYIKISSDRLLTIPQGTSVIEYPLSGGAAPITIGTGLSSLVGAAAGP